MLDRANLKRSEKIQLQAMVAQIRKDHPTMGCRDMYYKLRPEYMGRDAFEAFCRSEGLWSKRYRNKRRTTDSSGVIRFPNLIEGLTINKINQVWTSDITYYELNDRFYYITFIQDAYSRRILGHSVSDRLRTEDTTIQAIQKAIKTRKYDDLNNLILHSDGGGQYYDKEFIRLTRKHGIKNSMCIYPWENGKAERLNGVIKNNYLKHRTIKDLEDLILEVDRSVQLYNLDKPHIRLGRLTPIKFEGKVLQLQ